MLLLSAVNTCGASAYVLPTQLRCLHIFSLLSAFWSQSHRFKYHSCRNLSRESATWFVAAQLCCNMHNCSFTLCKIQQATVGAAHYPVRDEWLRINATVSWRIYWCFQARESSIQYPLPSHIRLGTKKSKSIPCFPRCSQELRQASYHAPPRFILTSS